MMKEISSFNLFTGKTIILIKRLGIYILNVAMDGMY
jgi:hypothetical protein